MRKAFTLIEVIIVLSIFSIVSVVSVSTFLTTFRVSQQTNIENSLLSDARFIMAQLTAAIQTNAIDYEEYFSHCVMNDDCPNQLELLEKSTAEDWDDIEHPEYGQNYGFYNWQFFYGGESTDADTPTHGYGTVCQESILPTPTYHEYPNDDCVTGPLAFSEDIDTGQNPNLINNGTSVAVNGSAFCSDVEYQLFTWGVSATGIDTAKSYTTCINSDIDFDISAQESYMMEELYLIDPRGERKTIFVSEKVTTDNDKVVSKIELDKDVQATKPSTGDNMPLFGFRCASGYNCSTITDEIDSHGTYAAADRAIPARHDPYVYASGENIFEDFVPISPLRVNVKSLKFLVTPNEDPRRAFDELDIPTEQPTVTIFMELEPSQGFKLPFLSKNFNLKLQTTVTSGVIEEVPIVSDSE